ncbi:MAG TPA: glycoside hydrolase family 18 protein [Candidatus Limnocylindrales bacterium]
MRALLRFLLVPVLVLSVAAAAPSSAAASDRDRSSARQVGYFTQWGIYGRQFYVKNLDTSGAAAKLSHINYAFANVSEEGRCFEANAAGVGDAWADYQWPVPAELSVDGVGDTWGEPLNGNFGQLLKLKQKYPNLKVMLSIGGWTWSTYFSNAATPENRAAFVASCLDIFIKGNLPVLDGGSGGPGSAFGVFDGIDLDWEWPGSAGEPGNVIRPEDKQNFTGLVAEFRRQLDALGKANGKRYEVSAFLPANPAAMDAGFETAKIFRTLDFATVQGYDFHGTWESVTNQQSALRSPDFSLSQVISDWMARGAPARKLVIGIPYFGRGWTGVVGGGDGYNLPAAGPAPATWEAGYEDFKVLRTKLDSFTVHRSIRDGQAWLFDGTTFWTYDDQAVVFQKALWARSRGLGGAMIWSLDGDTDDALLSRTMAFALGR